MEKDFYNLFRKIIIECKYTNTYKMAWAKALVEISLEKETRTETIPIELKSIANKFMKYYWDQTIFFDFVQGSNLKKPPLVVQYIKELINNYYAFTGTKKPDKFEKIEKDLKVNLTGAYNDCLDKIIKTLKKDVSWRFTYIDGENYNEIYKYNRGEDKLEILASDMNVLKKNHKDLYKLIDQKWRTILEEFNSLLKQQESKIIKN